MAEPPFLWFRSGVQLWESYGQIRHHCLLQPLRCMDGMCGSYKILNLFC